MATNVSRQFRQDKYELRMVTSGHESSVKRGRLCGAIAPDQCLDAIDVDHAAYSLGT